MGVQLLLWKAGCAEDMYVALANMMGGRISEMLTLYFHISSINDAFASLELQLQLQQVDV